MNGDSDPCNLAEEGKKGGNLGTETDRQDSRVEKNTLLRREVRILRLWS
jgi:hypothetical protein